MPDSNKSKCASAIRRVGSFVMIALFPIVGLMPLVGCNQPTGGDIVGTIVYRQKPVYPGIVMLRSDSGKKSYTAKLTAEGGFRVFDVEKGKYQVAIETIKLGSAKPTSSPTTPKEDDSGFPTRELTPPDQYKDSNVNIPDKYKSFDTSGLEIDCSETHPVAPIEFNLKR